MLCEKVSAPARIVRDRLFSVGLIPALLGFFGAGGALQEVCCFAGLLMLPHYINDFFCCACSDGLPQPSAQQGSVIMLSSAAERCCQQIRGT